MTFDSTGLIGKQPIHSEFLANSLITNSIASDLSDVGCGKTYCASAILRHLKRKFVIVCPILVKGTWAEVLASYGQTAELIIGFEKFCRGNTPYLKYRKPTKDEIAHYGHKNDVPKYILPVLHLPKEWVIVLDESHKCKGQTSLNAGFLMALKKQGYTVLTLSATQATSPLDMKAYGYATDMHNGSLKEFRKFCLEMGAEWTGKFSAMTFNVEDPEAKGKMAKAHYHLFDMKKIASRLTKADFKGIFPDHQVVAQAYDMGVNSDKIQSIYEDMAEELRKLEESCENYSQHRFAAIIKARRLVEMQKVPTLIEMVEELYEQQKAVAVFVSFTDTINALKERAERMYPGQVGCIYGEASLKDRLQDIADFQSDKKRIQFLNLAAGGQSINMHDLNGNYPRAFVINPSYRSIDILQSMGRHHRANAKTECYSRFVFADRTIEVPVCRRFQWRKDNIDMLNDGDTTPAIFDFAKGLQI
jgi:uncharacterized protein YukE